MTKFCLIELAENKLLNDIQGEPSEIVISIYQAMREQTEIPILILSAVAMWASKDLKNLTYLQQIVKQVPFVMDKD